MARRKALSDNEAIALMVLHYGGNPVHNILDHADDLKGLKEPYWLLLHFNFPLSLTEAEQLLSNTWHKSEGDAARAYCKFYELDS